MTAATDAATVSDDDDDDDASTLSSYQQRTVNLFTTIIRAITFFIISFLQRIQDAQLSQRDRAAG